MSESVANQASHPRVEYGDRVILSIVAAYASLFVAFGFVLDTPREILDGLIAILTSRDTLLTDYFGVGGAGAAFVNAGLLTLIACLIYGSTGARMTGAAVAALLLVLGFGLFGKNLLNVWPILLGVVLYSRFMGQPFAANINTAFFGIALSPIVSEIVFSSLLAPAVAWPLGIGTGLVIGFILPAAAAQIFKAHMGYALYNMGFTAGLVGVLVVALYKSYGFVPDPVFIWTTGNNPLMGAFLASVCASMILLGLVLDRGSLGGLVRILREPGQSPSDFIASAGLGPVLVNMGLSGAVAVAYVLTVGGELNGPVIGAVLSIMGFAAFGKHPANFLPIIAGVFLGSLAKPWGAADPSILLAALFATNLAPIAGRFGWHWGVVAGFVHSSAALSVGSVHGGLNLYNNGFAAGIVASILAPVIIAIQSRRGPPGGSEGQQAPASASASAARGGGGAMRRRGLWLRAALVRWLLYLALWIGLIGVDPLDLAVGAFAAAVATWASLYLLPPGAHPVRLAALPGLALRFLGQSVVAGLDIARRAFSPSMGLRPGFLQHRTGLGRGPARNVFAAITSLVPGTLVARDDDHGLLVHCLDREQPVAAGLAEDERRVSRAFPEARRG